ncbi:MAG TPA: DUF6058 family natural product biosynthesis protein [Actinophytocola sp.]|uniref:DUF6058 family natural product biosynthesis protein n=1 Tax=Actinophytocola sp. TaxID=1872138 RepID=UPI002DDCA32C|nr:DUF6058 family natural product biosynthesis protein [Actinophytocola sp.]HEV2780161.1 DUF6058 family natural product biosynthesis protein [Actinophytocola sp.]
MSDLARRVAARYVEINGEHPMTPADDAYVERHFVTLDELCVGRDQTPDQIRAHMLAGRLPLPGYLRSDGAEMVPADLLELADRAGGIERLPAWFHSQWADRAKAAAEWRSYLSGQYVCLRSVRPDTIIRKDRLTSAITEALADPKPESMLWRARLHILVDELESVELPFTGYDRLRFGGPTSRDTLIDSVRDRYPLDNPWTSRSGSDVPADLAC